MNGWGEKKTLALDQEVTAAKICNKLSIIANSKNLVGRATIKQKPRPNNGGMKREQ